MTSPAKPHTVPSQCPWRTLHSLAVLIVVHFFHVGIYTRGPVKSSCFAHPQLSVPFAVHSCRPTCLLFVLCRSPSLGLKHFQAPIRSTPAQPPRRIWLEGADLVLVQAAIVVVSIESEPSQLVKKSSPDQTVKPLQDPSNLLAASISRVNETSSAGSDLRLRFRSCPVLSCPAHYHRDLFICPPTQLRTLFYAALTFHRLPARSVLDLSFPLHSHTHSNIRFSSTDMC